MKLRALTVTNFAGIGDPGVTIPIDDIVVLTGPNNSGKSSILAAYRAFASTGSPLPIRAFRDEDESLTVVVSGVFSDLTDEDREIVGTKWEFDDPSFGMIIRLKWEWSAAGDKAQKFSWDNDATDWIAGGMGGWDTLITSRIPFPLCVKPTDDPEETEAQIVQILTAAAKAALKKDATRASAVLATLQALADEFAKDTQKELDDACTRITKKLGNIFPDHKVSLQQAVGKIDADKIIGSGSHVRIEEPGGKAVPLSHQGAGMRRTFLWAALALSLRWAEPSKARSWSKLRDRECC